MAIRSLVIVSALLAVVGCAPGAEVEPDGDIIRGPLGKADSFGTCEGACGGPAALGLCWCDAACETYGDCCSDVAQVCEAQRADVPECGGVAGFTCGEGAYCHYEAGVTQACGYADQLGSCLPKPEACTFVYQPVCGCDGETYSNECLAHAAGANVVYEGECEAPAPVPTDALCLGADDCDAGYACDTSVCLSGCPEGEICPQVCYGQCVPL